MTLTLIAIFTFISTLIGGLFALYLKDRLHLILGFSAGAIIGVAFFDIIPEALELAGSAYDEATILTLTVVGFSVYLLLDRLFLLHGHSHTEEHSHDHHEHHNHERGAIGASSLSVHSFLDGVGIGLAFQVSPTVGVIVAAAVLTHDFSDGINTVNMILKNGGERMKAFRWLLVDATAPILGIIATMFFSVSDEKLGLLLALFGGFFLYIGASDLIPESYHKHPMRWTTISTVLGIAVMYFVIKLAGL